MSRLVQVLIGILLPIMLCISSIAHGDSSMTLEHNPFSKPAMLALPVARPAKREEVVEQSFELQLTATLVSEFAPMVIVEGKMLGIGDEIEGFRLLAVDEGRAVFQKNANEHTFTLVGNGVDVE